MNHEEIANLGSLVNITVTPEESQDLIPKMSSVLGYIDQIKQIDVDAGSSCEDYIIPELRADAPHDMQFKNDFLGQVPEKDGNYVKVTKVLGGDQ